MFALIREFVSLFNSTCRDSSCTLESFSTWTPKTNAWKPNADPGDNWTGAKNPFGPEIPLGAHGLFGSAPPVGGWESGECATRGVAQCGGGPAPAVTPGHGWGVKNP
mmetsp:Transcript_9629/g.19296  ORF Transcript_9629/g.19296 Transcript_9629/m.19296 type:complete len:107 (+) Transcript_9629:107-427(+)|eukprot:CAMPEP_0181309018 /NCGR_PEP_ID=MMETSP1101-20121128/11789_1 /TAXON_ID=46948 /ORGANISM="Rhodomonas abbreviata, Strain Caron Lab Isolate" /LENGTH=106 /DNA_ID=CAMNT_0023415473 /DNA_START=68 /DNA_END=388 /DNA_ORIENTATION=-